MFDILHKNVFANYSSSGVINMSGDTYIYNFGHGRKDGYRIPDRRIPDRRIPDRRIPDRRIPDRRIPDKRIPDRRIPDRRIPDRRIPLY